MTPRNIGKREKGESYPHQERRRAANHSNTHTHTPFKNSPKARGDMTLVVTSIWDGNEYRK